MKYPKAEYFFTISDSFFWEGAQILTPEFKQGLLHPINLNNGRRYLLGTVFFNPGKKVLDQESSPAGKMAAPHQPPGYWVCHIHQPVHHLDVGRGLVVFK